MMQALLVAGQATKARLVLRGAVQAAEADPLSLLLAAKAAVAVGGEALAEGVALARCASKGVCAKLQRPQAQLPPHVEAQQPLPTIQRVMC